MERIAPGYYKTTETRAVDGKGVDVEVFKKGRPDKNTGYGSDSGWGYTLVCEDNHQFAQSEDFIPTKSKAIEMYQEFLRCCVWNDTYGWVIPYVPKGGDAL